MNCIHNTDEDTTLIYGDRYFGIFPKYRLAICKNCKKTFKIYDNNKIIETGIGGDSVETNK